MRFGGSLEAVRAARKAAAHGLETLRAEIASLRSRLDELVAEQKHSRGLGPLTAVVRQYVLWQARHSTRSPSDP